MKPIRMRHELVMKYSWAVPTDEALDTIKRHSENGLVEIGAGTGYWAGLLRARGVDVVAYDLQPYDSYNADGQWSEVLRGGQSKVREHPDRTLFLCWPPYNRPMAREALRYYAGDTLVYIGEGYGGCTGDDRFHRQLNLHWSEVEDVGLPQWYGIHDGLMVYKRKEN